MEQRSSLPCNHIHIKKSCMRAKAGFLHIMHLHVDLDLLFKTTIKAPFTQIMFARSFFYL